MTETPNPAENDARVGATLGKWTLDRLIGVGGMASVYAASHRNGAQAAIKILRPEFARRAEARTRFMREAYIANKVGPGAVRVLDDDVDDEGSPYLVMELLTGESVEARADRMGGRLKVLEVLWIARETLATLEVAHGHSIIHRDLKPENLFWTEDERVKVLDFGIARFHAGTHERTIAGTIMGTPDFMAPEQALGRAEEIDARTDIWSVGAIMFRLLAGRDVHVTEGQNPLVVAATSRAPRLATLLPALPKDVLLVVDRALEFERDARYPSARAMREDIERFADAEEIATGSASIRLPSAKASIAPSPHAGKPTEFPAEDGAPPFPAQESPSAGLATGMSEESTLALRDLFGLIELALLSRADIEARARDGQNQRWLEAAHLGSFRKLQMAYKHAVNALSSAHIGLFWNVLPEGFATKQGLLWQSTPPLPPTPAAMYEGGVRMLGLLPGLELEEFGEIVRLIHGDTAPFSDFATFLQASQLPHLVHRIDPNKPGMPEHESVSVDSTVSGSTTVPMMLEALGSGDAALRAALLKRLERVGDGYEEAIGALLPTAGLELGVGLFRVLSTLGTPAAQRAMLRATESAVPIVRIEALAALAPNSERLTTELRGLLGAADAKARIEGLVALETFKIKAADSALALRIRSPSFDVLPVEERRQALRALGALSPARAEKVALGLLTDQKAASAQDREPTRELACETLGRIGASKEARDALLAAARSRVRTTEGVRKAARLALDAIDARAEGRESAR